MCFTSATRTLLFIQDHRKYWDHNFCASCQDSEQFSYSNAVCLIDVIVALPSAVDMTTRILLTAL